MAETVLTLNQLITINDRNLADIDVPNFLNSSPFMRTNAATIASQNTVHKFLRYTNPDTGFRDANDGREVQQSQDTLVSVDCKILDASYRTDLALADEYRLGRQAWVDREGFRALDSAFFEAEQQVFQGTAYDAKGFDGFPDDATMASLGGGMVVNAGGAANLTSVYVVRDGDMDVEIVTGASGNIAIEPWSIQEHAGATGTYPAIYVPITAWYALKIGSTVTSAVRIANIDYTVKDGSAGGLTDDLIYDAIKMFGSGRQPTRIYMHRYAMEALRAQRTTYNPVGAPAPRMDQIEGIPVTTTDGISVAESAVI